MVQLQRWFIRLLLACIGALLLLAVLPNTQSVQAQDPIPFSANSNCVVCHENLYLLHDTGNYFCLNESPMSCVTCHGGDPTAVTKEAAHSFRDPHPVVGTDMSRCQTCHPAECSERISIFDQKAGIGNILVVPTYDVAAGAKAVTTGNTPAHAVGVSFWQVLPLSILILLSLGMGLWINKGFHPA